MRCYIFSNCLKSTKEEYLENVKKLGIKPSDHLIFLNKGNLLYPFEDYFKQFKHIHILMRNCGRFGLNSYFGFDSAYEHSTLFETMNTIATSRLGILLVIGKPKGTCKSYNIANTKIVKYINSTHCTPTTGYLAYYAATTMTPAKDSDIVLVNFYGNDDNSTTKWKGHDWSFEDEWLQDKTRVFC